MNTFTKFAASSVAAVVALGVSAAHAAEPENIDSPPAKTTEVAQVAVTTDGTGRANAGTDHDQFVGKFAIGYMGFRQMQVATDGGTDFAVGTVEAPVIGARYWLSSFLGIDAGLGFATGGTTTEAVAGGTTVETDVGSPFALILHAGLPLALADSEHFVFQVVPELNFGFASNTDEGVGMEADTDLSGTHFDIGARAGAEIHFGFIDIPQLSLQAGVGLRFSVDSAGADDGTAEVSSSTTALTTGVGDNPWNIFTSNIAALYYFDM